MVTCSVQPETNPINCSIGSCRSYDVVERHHASSAAPAAVTLDVAETMDLPTASRPCHLQGTGAILGAEPDERPRPRGLLAEVSPGWGVLAESPRAGDRRRCRHEAVGTERHVPLAAAGRFRGIQRARLREDRLDAPRGSD